VFVLSIDTTELDADSLSILAGCENLESLDLSNTGITSINQLPELPKLATLTLRDTNLFVSQLESIKPQKSLTFIDMSLSNPNKQSVKQLLSGVQSLKHISQLPVLERLTLGCIDAYDHSLLSSLTRAFPSLIWLDGVRMSTHSKLIAQESRVDEFERNQSISKICPPMMKEYPSPRRPDVKRDTEQFDSLVSDVTAARDDLDELDDACEKAVKDACAKYGISADG
jgi:hypothetical protein